MDTVVTTATGQVRGISEEGVDRYLGIPYAAAPVGDLRFKPPAPHPGWSEIRGATVYGATAPKPPYPRPYDEFFDEPVIEGDEPLNLNIWSPSGATGAPVFVWIHGGAFVNGAGSVPEYNGTSFARDGVVCVTINYRLGAEGFCHIDQDTTNLGLRDQIAALRWVRANIEAFGGDPAQVTIGGESAGAMSVATLLASPLAEGLFHGAIMESGAGHHAISPPTAKAVAEALAAKLGVPATREGLSSVPSHDLVEAQRALSAEIAVVPDPQRWGEIALNAMAWEPVVGDDLAPVLPIGGIRAGAGSEVRVLIGTNKDENRLFLVPSGISQAIDQPMLEMGIAAFGATDVPAALDIYRDEIDGSPGDLMAAVSTDWFFWIPAVRLLEMRAGGGADSFSYRFDWPSPVREGTLGAFHAAELPFVFDTLGTAGAARLVGKDAPQALADEMHGAWVAFIKTGRPGWEPYSPDRRTVKLFDTTPSVVIDPSPERRQLWEGAR